MERRVASDVDPDSVMDQQARPSSEAAEEASQVVHEDALRSLKNKRKAKLEQLLRQRSKIHQFMDEDCYSVVEDRMLPAFYQLLKELCDINDSLKETYQERKLEDDMEIDQDWFDTRLSALRGRGDDIACRLTEVRQRREEARKANESVAPEDSVCLKSGHMSRHCQEVVNCQLCSGTHNTLLHVKPKERQSVDRDNLAVFNGLVNSKRKQNFDDMPKNTECILAIIPVRVKAKKGNKVITLYAFLDPGSTATFCTDELLDELNLRGKKVSLIVTTMTESKVVTSTMVTELEVGHLNSNTFIELKEVFSQKAIPVSRNNIPRQEDIDKWPHLKGVQVPLIDAAIGLLIGTDAAKMMEPKEVIPSVDDGPFAVRTILGWTVNGPLKVDGCNTSRNEIMQAMSNRVSVARLEDLWKQQFKYDFPEDGQEERYEMSKADRLFMERVRQSARLVDGHYCLDLPLKELNIKMPNNRAVAEQRATTLKRKFLRNPSFRADYITFMNDTITKKYAVKVPIEDLGRCDGKVWYIPHHGVYHPKKLKLRVVFDCGASYQGTSLNEQLLQGPNLTSTIIGVLTRFRQEPVTIVADVEAMFHQVKVSSADADLLRFLWWPDGDVSRPMAEYRMEVHLFGATSSPSCANYALRRCAEDNTHLFDDCTVNTVLRNFYVDDCLKSVETVEKAESLYHSLKTMCQMGGFRLNKWISNDSRVLAAIPEEEKATEIMDLDLDKNALPVERVLGVQWCIQSDQFKFRVVIQSKPPTRRGILSMLSSVYDPLGMLAPVNLYARNIMQELCRMKLGWDEIVPEHLAQMWSQWVQGLEQLTDFGIERCFKPKDFGQTVSAQLHHFADASENGYGTVTYLVQRNISNQAHSAFVLGKARVAPLKPMTIPRLELTAATLAVRIDKMLRKELELPLEDSVYWTDSTAVLKYISNETSRFRTFVANRVSAIQQTSTVSQWHYVNSHLNPADGASRGQKVKAFLRNKLWVSGPDFLTQAVGNWPRNPDSQEIDLDVADPEVKRNVTVNVLAVEESTDIVQRLMEYYSSWTRLKRAVVWFLRLKDMLLTSSRRRKGLLQNTVQNIQLRRKKLNYKTRKKNLTVDELKEAEVDIIRHCQRKSFPDEISSLLKGEAVKRSSHIHRLNPVLQDGILRVGGRLSRAAMPEESKHPAILAKNHRVSQLILQDIHERIGHGGRNHVLSTLRQRYWIPNAISAIRKILSSCRTCRRLHGATGRQQMADLPLSRVLPDEPPFTRTGVDCFGPFTIKRGRTIAKRYGVIFTCMATRAVHIEVAASLDTDSFINALRRFIARRGQVLEIHSDNGTNFVGAERELKRSLEEWNMSKIENRLTQSGIKWMFNPPSASHFGGVWERLIRSVRKVLSATLKDQSLDEEGLQTLLCEVEAILNSRPITTPSDDPNDLEALTPNHLLLLKTQPSIPQGVFQEDDLYSRRRWRQVQYMADLFWKRWVKEYLPELQRRQKWTHAKRNFVPGDIVLIVDESAPRNSWVIGRIIHAIQDERGLVRQVRIKTRTNEFDRPITKVCLLQESE
ncbi:hypothetical protein Q8A73_010395 [Channa argus]|nr:hypothetical protein Q8A73_010395 [Channa argus]